jgi:hypothetical protein
MTPGVQDIGKILRHGAVAAAGVLVALVVTGCGGASNPPMPSTEALVRASEIARAGGDSPSAVTLRLWRSVQLGDAVSAASFYDARVLGRIGFVRVSGTLAQQRTNLEVLHPKVLSVIRTPVGVQVAVRARNVVNGTRQSRVEVFSFLLRRSASGWRVMYDTLLGDTLPSYVQARVQQRVAPTSQAVSPRAQLAAQRLGDAYRTLISDVAEAQLGKQQKPSPSR